MPEALIQRVVRVTPELIERGVSCAPMSCPIALALLEAFDWVSVGPTFCYVHKGRSHRELRPTPDLAAWIGRFDDGEHVEPIEIAINLEDRRLWIVPDAPAGARWTPDGLLEWDASPA